MYAGSYYIVLAMFDCTRQALWLVILNPATGYPISPLSELLTLPYGGLSPVPYRPMSPHPNLAGRRQLRCIAALKSELHAPPPSPHKIISDCNRGCLLLTSTLRLLNDRRRLFHTRARRQAPGTTELA